MGLQDREYMHERERRERPFMPPKNRDFNLWMVMFTIVGVLGLYQGYAWLLDRKAKQAVGAERAVSDAPMQPAYRCIVRGQPVLSATPCAPTEVPPAAHAVPPQRQAPPVESPRSAGSVTLYHCKAYSGGSFWANTHCNQHRALIDRMVSVPGHLPFAQQVEIAEGDRAAAARLIAEQQRQTHVTVVPTARDQRMARAEECRALNERIAYLDALARQPKTARTQDWIRAERKKTRDRQFALRC
ncbi:hypothetical protein [Hydrogenophaga palleronii]|uniref:hypothetical protein n=1 Tax=Hydrogenophaga palleronii TaxID=65655 RepID=UPI0008269930|nr:hypothetical protein [Hydrogenophaga palleronii]